MTFITMPDFTIALIASSFIAGLFTFFAPCTLPLVPAFLGVISGVGREDLKDPEKIKEVRGRIFVNALFYVLGFSLIFILFGVAFSFLGKILIFRLWIQRVGGVLIALFGLVLLGWLKLPFLRKDYQIRVPKLFQRAGKTNSFAIGSLFALGWSPCVGPLLGSILLLASGSQTVFQGTLLLVVFSAGLAIPFLLTALLIGRAFSAFDRWGRALRIINVIGGVFLLALGVLLVSDQFTSVFNSLRGALESTQFYQSFINQYL